MIEILTWVSIIAGGILILLLLLSLIGGLDIDVDADIGSTDVDSAGGGGLGIIKGVLTFVSVTSWVIKLLLATQKSPVIAIGIGLVSGLAALLLLNYIVVTLLKNDSNVNYSMDDALFQSGTVYLKIPSGENTGIIHVNVKGAKREMKAKSFDGSEIETGKTIDVMDIDGEYAVVRLTQK
jgi:hypothetical protein